MKTFKLHLIRHGITQGNLDGVYVGGGLDMPLCEQGIKELQKLSDQFRYPNVGVLFSSPMKRALQTAEILYPLVQERIVVEELRENIFGEFEGRKAADLLKDPRFTDWLNPESEFVPKGGESGSQFTARTAQALMRMMQFLVEHGVTEGVCITHGGVIMSMLSQKAMPRKPYAEWMADNGCGFTVQADTAMLMRDNFVEAIEIVPNGYLDMQESGKWV